MGSSAIAEQPARPFLDAGVTAMQAKEQKLWMHLLPHSKPSGKLLLCDQLTVQHKQPSATQQVLNPQLPAKGHSKAQGVVLNLSHETEAGAMCLMVGVQSKFTHGWLS